MAFEADGIFCFLLDQILKSSFGFKIRVSQHFQSKWINVDRKSANLFFFFFLWKKVVLKYYRCLKLCQVSENTSDFSLLCSPEMFNGNMILIVLKSFRELKFLVAILERFGNYLSIKNFKCQSSFFPDFFLKHKIVNSAIFFLLILMKMFFVWNIGTS